MGTHVPLPLVCAVLAVWLGAAPASSARGTTGPRISGVTVSNDGPAYEGDRRLLTTISPDGDGLRDTAAISFRLSQPARVTLRIARTTSRPVPVYTRIGRFGRGRHTLFWSPRRANPRTYVVLLSARDLRGNRRTYGARSPEAAGRRPTAVIRVLGLDASFERASYRPGALARLRIATDAQSVTVQLFRAGGEKVPTPADNVMNGIPVGDPVTWTFKRRNRTKRVAVTVPALPSALYYAQLTSPGGRVGYAPIVVRPPLLGGHRVAVVLPTYTWQAYNFRDGDGDGYGDTWYTGSGQPVRLARPYLRRGVPPHYRKYELGFLRWLVSMRHWQEVDVLADVDLELARDGAALARNYDLIVFPGHTEYVTTRIYDAVTRYRNLGGNVVFLASNNFFWKVRRRGSTLRKVRTWRALGRPEAGLIGVQYRANDNGARQGQYVVRGAAAAPWLFAGTGLSNGSLLTPGWGFGIEIDGIAPSSPPGTVVLADIPNLLGAGYTAQMTYYETPAGAKVFAAGTMNFGGRALIEPVRQLLENLWHRLARP